MKKTVKTRPERYLRREQALAYHASTNAGAHPSLSQRLELRAVRHAIADAGGGSSVLDAPCGTGRLDPILRGHFDAVVGVDSSAAMLSVYRDQAPARAGCCCDIFALPFDDNAFDWVVCHRYFHHLHSHEERVALLSGLRRVCRVGVVFYAWIDTPLARRKSSMRASITKADALRAIGESGLALARLRPCAGPFSVKAMLVCTKSDHPVSR